VQIHLTPLFAPVVLAIGAVAAFLGPGRRPRLTPKLAEAAALIAFIAALVSLTGPASAHRSDFRASVFRSGWTRSVS